MKEQTTIQLNTVSSAVYRSQLQEKMPRCLLDTRVAILNQIKSWINSDQSEVIFWLSGLTGTGKSTVSQTIAAYLGAERNRLAASYFFKRGEKDRNGSARFFSTIAKDLIKTIPMFKSALKKSLDDLDHDKVDDFGLEKQFKGLIYTPLSNIGQSSFIVSKVIVIDALDECEEEENISKICELLAKLHDLSTVRLRVLITSRHDYPTLGAFEHLNELQVAYQHLSLDREYLEDTKSDISIFLTNELHSIRSKFNIGESSWPGNEGLKEILGLATTPSPLFIYAATLCRFLDDPNNDPWRRKDPKKQLKLWLENRQASQLNQIYSPILFDLLGSGDDRPDKDDLSELQEIIRAIVFLAVPLTAAHLGDFLGIEEHSIQRWLQNLHAVVKFPDNPHEPVQLFHKSFRDFLTQSDQENQAGFRISEETAHAMLASKCLQRMNRGNDGLRRDICKIGRIGSLLEEIDSNVISQSIPTDLQYACQYWVYHLRIAKQPILDEGEAHTFFKTHFLHWLEALSLIKNISLGIIEIRNLETILLENPKATEFLTLVQDATRFIQYNSQNIANAPLQTYESALIFSPKESLIRKVFESAEPHWITMKPIMELNWSPCLLTLKKHENMVNSLAISPCSGKKIASGSYGEVRIWDSITGLLETRLRVGDDRSTVSCIVFSPDEQLLMATVTPGEVWLWNVENASLHSKLSLTGAKQLEVERTIKAIAFSQDGNSFAIIRDDGFTHIGDTKKGEYRSQFTISEGFVSESLVQGLSFSSDGQHLLILFSSGHVLVYTMTGEEVRQQKLKEECKLGASACSPDGMIMASDVSGEVNGADSTAHTDFVLWSAEDGTSKMNYENLLIEPDYTTRLTFSSDGRWLVASAYFSPIVQVMNTYTRSEPKVVQCGRGKINLAILSPDGKRLITASGNNVQVWDTLPLYSLSPKISEFASIITVVAFSPNGKRLAIGSLDQTIKIWNVETSKFDQAVTGKPSWVSQAAFSFDGQMLAFRHGWGHNRVNIWNLREKATQLEIRHERVRGTVNIEASPDGRILVVGVNEGFNGHFTELWDMYTCKLLYTIKDTSQACLGCLADRRLLAFVEPGRSRDIKIWDLENEQLQHTIDNKEDILDMSFSLNGDYLAINANGSETLRIKPEVWDTKTWTIPNNQIELNYSQGIRVLNPSLFDTSQERQWSGYSIEDSWITLDSRKVLCLPLEYRPAKPVIHGECAVHGVYAVHGANMVIGCVSGRMLWFRFCISEYRNC